LKMDGICCMLVNINLLLLFAAAAFTGDLGKYCCKLNPEGSWNRLHS
jgi:hypothetical protein